MRGKHTLVDVYCHCKMVLVMGKSPTIAVFLQCNGGKLDEAEDFKCVLSFNVRSKLKVCELLSNNVLLYN